MIHSFLMIGQSNMAGRGEIGGVPPIENPHLKVLRNGRWQPLFVPVNPDRPFSGLTLAESFADAYQKAHGVDVGLIPCADGGTQLEQWREGSLLFDHAVLQARLAERTSTIAGVLWHQGESDCKPGLCETYLERLKEIIRTLCKYKGVEILEGHMMPDHVHLVLSIPPKISVSSFMGYLKGKSALMMFEKHANLKYKFGNRHFWAEGYYVSTVGLNEETIRKYVREQEKHDQAIDKLSVKEYEDPFKKG